MCFFFFLLSFLLIVWPAISLSFFFFSFNLAYCLEKEKEGRKERSERNKSTKATKKCVRFAGFDVMPRLFDDCVFRRSPSFSNSGFNFPEEERRDILLVPLGTDSLSTFTPFY